MTAQEARAYALPFCCMHKAPGRQKATRVICDALANGGRYARIRVTWIGMSKWTDVAHLADAAVSSVATHPEGGNV